MLINIYYTEIVHRLTFPLQYDLMSATVIDEPSFVIILAHTSSPIR